MKAVLWRRLDRPGHESALLRAVGSGWRLEGAAVFAHERSPCRLDYRVLCDERFRTLSADVSGWVGPREVAIAVCADGDGRWTLDGREVPGVAGCTDVDLNFSPSTNLLSIRRLDLAVGAEALVRAAWLRFPGFGLEPLEQIYRRTGPDAYRYESGGGRFAADLRVDAVGFVLEYPGFCRAEDGRDPR